MMNCKYRSILAALCMVVFSLAGCSKENAPADLTDAVTSAVQPSDTVTEKGIIGLEEAENAAFAHAGISEAEANIIKSELDRNKENLEYEIEFTSNNYKYEYDINAEDGSVIKFSKEAVPAAITETAVQTSASGTRTETSQTTEIAKPEVTIKPTETQKPIVTTTSSSAVNSGTITSEEAKTAALEHAGLTASDVTFTKAKLDRDDGIFVYEIEFYTASYEYEYDINASTGAVIKYSQKALGFPAMKNLDGKITSEEAKAAALEYAELTASDVTFTKIELEYDDGVAEYEVKFKYGKRKYEFKIDAYSGNVLKAEID